MTTETTAPYIVVASFSDCSNAFSDRYPRDMRLTVTQMDQAMREVAAEKDPSGGYAKLRGSLHFGDHEIEFRIDVDHDMSEGATLAQRMATVAKYWVSEHGRAYAAGLAEDQPLPRLTAEARSDVYRAAALACLMA